MGVSVAVGDNVAVGLAVMVGVSVAVAVEVAVVVTVAVGVRLGLTSWVFSKARPAPPTVIGEHAARSRQKSINKSRNR